MTGTEKCGLVLAAGFANEFDRLRCIFGIETGGWLVCEDQRRAGGEGPSHGHSLLLSDAQLAGHRAGPIDAESFKKRVCASSVFVGRGSREEEGKLDVLSCSEPFQQIECLKDHADRSSSKAVSCGPVQCGDVLSVYLDAPGIGLDQPGDQRQEGAFSAPRSADQEDLFGFQEAEVREFDGKRSLFGLPMGKAEVFDMQCLAGRGCGHVFIIALKSHDNSPFEPVLLPLLWGPDD
jgi:hypothetical protein